MNIRDPSRDRILDRDHGEFGRAVLYGSESVLEARVKAAVEVGKSSPTAGDMRIGARFALEGSDLLQMV